MSLCLFSPAIKILFSCSRALFAHLKEEFFFLLLSVTLIILFLCRDPASLQESVTRICSEARQTPAFISSHSWRFSSCTSIQVRSNHRWSNIWEPRVLSHNEGSWNSCCKSCSDVLTSRSNPNTATTGWSISFPFHLWRIKLAQPHLFMIKDTLFSIYVHCQLIFSKPSLDCPVHLGPILIHTDKNEFWIGNDLYA